MPDAPQPLWPHLSGLWDPTASCLVSTGPLDGFLDSFYCRVLQLVAVSFPLCWISKTLRLFSAPTTQITFLTITRLLPRIQFPLGLPSPSCPFTLRLHSVLSELFLSLPPPLELITEVEKRECQAFLDPHHQPYLHLNYLPHLLIKPSMLLGWEICPSHQASFPLQ